MNCPDCGSVLRPGDAFCPRCGRSRNASTLSGGGIKQVIRTLLDSMDRWYTRFSADVVSPNRQVRDRARILGAIGVIVLLALLTGGGITRLIGLIVLSILVLMPLATSLRRSL